MLIICDFDGTVTARDTNSHLARSFAPEAFHAVEGKLATRELSLREVLAAEFERIDATIDELVAAALEIPFRAGFDRFLDSAQADGHSVVVLSSGFHELIEPMLAREGLADRVPLCANRLTMGVGGGRITWRELPTCDLCGEPCKRHDVAQLRAGVEHDGRAFDHVVFVGDGFSDRCGAESADRVFARDSLATWLTEQGEPWEPWDDFDDIAASLGIAGARP